MSKNHFRLNIHVQKQLIGNWTITINNKLKHKKQFRKFHSTIIKNVHFVQKFKVIEPN